MNPEALVEMGQALRVWRQGHPHATFDEIETEVQRHLAQVQAQVVAELIQPRPADPGDPEAQVVPAEGARPLCPQCHASMQASGRRGRAVVTRLGQRLHLERAYYVCLACGVGHFPPG
jgi:hypothetical protein